MAIPSLQRPLLEYETRVRESRLPNDVCDGAQAVSEHCSKTFVPYTSLQYRYVRVSHHLDIRLGFAANQSVLNIPFVEIPIQSGR